MQRWLGWSPVAEDTGDMTETAEIGTGEAPEASVAEVETKDPECKSFTEHEDRGANSQD